MIIKIMIISYVHTIQKYIHRKIYIYIGVEIINKGGVILVIVQQIIS